MKVIWTAIAGVCLLAAAIALWRQQLNSAFVIATIGLMAWFLRYRSDLKGSLAENGSRLKDDSEVESSDEDS